MPRPMPWVEDAPWWVNGQSWPEREIVVAEAMRLARVDHDWDEHPADIYFHRDIPGPHRNVFSCWCCPHVVNSSDRRAPSVIAAELDNLERRH